MKDAFFSFEGIDGCGKTTQILLTKEFLEKLEYKVAIFREPGGTSIGEKIRQLLLHSSDSICDRTEVLLYIASRAQLFHEKIAPLLAQGFVVLSDRSADSSVAYQGYGRGLPIEEVIALNDFAIRKLYPTKTFFLDITAEESKRRLASKTPDRLEAEHTQFFTTVRQGYLILTQRFQDRFIRLDGCMQPEILNRQVLFEIAKVLQITL